MKSMQRNLATMALLYLSLVLAACGGGGGPAAAPPSNLDTSFGNGGKVVTEFTGLRSEVHAVAIQPSDGKIVVAGYAGSTTDIDFALARYNTDGSLDTGFGSSGVTTTPFFSGMYDGISSIAIQNDGRIIAAGYAQNGTQSDFALARYNVDGSLDTSFNNTPSLCAANLPCQGKWVSLRAGDDSAAAVAVQSDGKILAAGGAQNGTQSDFALLRLNQNGTLDTGFGSAGMAFTDIFIGGTDYARAIAIQTDGKILVAGYTHDGTHSYVGLARYNTNGTLDTSFNPRFTCSFDLPDCGTLATDFGTGADVQYATVVVQADGKILVGGSAGTRIALERYNTNGTLDTTFGPADTGRVTTTVPGLWGLANIVLQADGKIVAAGTVNNSANYEDFFVARYTVDGALDVSFGNGGTGMVQTDFLNDEDFSYALAVQPLDGKIVAAGSAYNNDNGAFHFAIARYLP